jgi:hypothetical protein
MMRHSGLNCVNFFACRPGGGGRIRLQTDKQTHKQTENKQTSTLKEQRMLITTPQSSTNKKAR